METIKKTKTRAPVNGYGLSKLWLEDLGEMYSRVYGISVIAARLGWFIRNEEEFKEILSHPLGNKLYLSVDDANNFFYSCLLENEITFSIIYALSKQGDNELFDLHPSVKIISYSPKDKLKKYV